MFFSLPAATGDLILEGNVPDTAWLSGQRLEISINGEPIASEMVRGGFRLVLRASVPYSRYCLLAVNAIHDVKPVYDAPHLDGGARRIAYRLDRIIWTGWEYLPTGARRPVIQSDR